MAAPSENSLKIAQAILADHPAIDFHTHLGLWETRGLGIEDPIGRYIGDERLAQIVRDMIKSGCKTASLNMTSDIPILKFGAPGNRSRDFAAGEAWAEYQRLKNLLHELLDVAPIGIARNFDDIGPLHKQGKLALLLSVEGGHMVEEDLTRLVQLRTDGVSKFQPMHYARTTIGDNQTDPEEIGGLSDFGRQAVVEAARNGMLIDAAHATFQATSDMAVATGGPIMLSHTLMTYKSKLSTSNAPPNPRWISQDHAQLIANTGGLIGTWAIHMPFGAGSAEEFVEAVMAMVDLVGIDHVCWATDFLQAGMGPWFTDYDAFPLMCARFLDAGMNEDDLQKFLSGNVARVYDLAMS